MRHEERYGAAGGDARFPGGSTEQKDAWIGDRGHARNTPAQNTDYRVQHADAQSKLDAPDAELLAWARPFLTGAATLDILFGVLLGARKEQIGRSLFMSEREALHRVAWHLWSEPRAATEAA